MSGIFGGLQLFDKANALQVNGDELGELLERSTGLTREAKRQSDILGALANPDTAYVKYAAEAKKKAAVAGDMIAKDYKTLIDEGFTAQQAYATAYEKGSKYLDSEMALLKIQYPIANNLDLLAEATAGTKVNLPKNLK